MSRFVDIESLDVVCFKDKSEEFVAGVQWVLEKLDSLSERPVGHWIKGVGENGVTTSLFCANCHQENKYWEDWKFCPNCGVLMEKIKD